MRSSTRFFITGFFTGDLLQGQFSALLVQFLETIKTVTAVTHNLAGS